MVSPGISKPAERRRRGLFTKELRAMMYGYGDDSDPLSETMLLVEEIMVVYITEMMHRAQDMTVKGKLSEEQIMFLVRKDPAKLARVKELLAMHKVLKRARKAFEVDEDKLAAEE